MVLAARPIVQCSTGCGRATRQPDAQGRCAVCVAAEADARLNAQIAAEFRRETVTTQPEPESPTVLTRECRRCGETKPLTAFTKNKAEKDGLSRYCQPCAYAAAEVSRQKKKQERAARQVGVPLPPPERPNAGHIMTTERTPEPVNVEVTVGAGFKPAGILPELEKTLAELEAKQAELEYLIAAFRGTIRYYESQ